MSDYIKHKLENLIVVNKIITLYSFEFDKDFVFNEESHDFWEVVVALKEDIICTSDDERTVLKEGEILFHKPNERHSLMSNKIKGPSVIIFSFDCHSQAMKFFNKKKFKLTKNQLFYLNSIMEIGKNTFNLHSDPTYIELTLVNSPTLGGQQLIKNYIELLLIDIMRNESETKAGKNIFLKEEELDNKLIKDILTALKDNVYSKITLKDLSKKTSYSTTYMLKKFKSTMKCGIIDYYINLKIEKAKELLRENELSVKEISEKLSFDTPNYFTKTFKRVTTLTPLEYKKSTL